MKIVISVSSDSILVSKSMNNTRVDLVRMRTLISNKIKELKNIAHNIDQLIEDVVSEDGSSLKPLYDAKVKSIKTLLTRISSDLFIRQ